MNSFLLYFSSRFLDGSKQNTFSCNGTSGSAGTQNAGSDEAPIQTKNMQEIRQCICAGGFCSEPGAL
jgi:hypothetical protein